jgi:hypothetical protein
MTAEFGKPEEDIMAAMRSIYTQTVIDHAMNPRNAGNLKDSDGFASFTGPCGDTMENGLGLKIAGFERPLSGLTVVVRQLRQGAWLLSWPGKKPSQTP